MAVPRNFQKLWLLFAVVATALVWTWSQVGQQQQSPGGTVAPEDLRLLRTEADCNLATGPCAAYGRDLAFVAAVSVAGEGLRWRLKLAGDGAPAMPRMAAQLIAPDRSQVPLSVVQVGDQWQAYSRGLAQAGSTLRVRVSVAAQSWVAEFPLRAATP